MVMQPIFRLFCGLAVVASFASAAATGYYGTKIGPLSELHHGVSGDVYAIDSRTILLKNFNYDGEGPAAYFYVGTSSRISNKGATRLRDERGHAGVIHRYRNRDVMLQLPEGKTLRDFKWFAIWCDEFSVNFGDVRIPKNFQFPKPQKIDALSGVHGVASDNLVIVDAQTLLIPNFSYDGEAPDAKFWVGYGQKPTPNGIRIPDENGREQPLARYDKKTIVLTLPGDLTVFEIGHFGIWCEAFTVDFGHVKIPATLNVPPSLRMLGISPESKLNCEVLFAEKSFEVRWAIAGDSVVIQLLAKLENNEYMSFGLSPDRKRSEMIGADVAVAWLDRQTGKGQAVDYHLADKSQCSGKRGSCPDVRIDPAADSIRLLNAALVNDFSIVTYQRPLRASDALDLAIVRNETQAIVWAIGPLNERREVSFHTHFNKQTQSINFGRKPVWNCQLPDGQMSMRPEAEAQPEDDEEDIEEDGDEQVPAQEEDEVEDDVEDLPAYNPRQPPASRRPAQDNRRQEIVRHSPAPPRAADETVLIDNDDAVRNRQRVQPLPQSAAAPKPQHFMSQRNDELAPHAAAAIATQPPRRNSVPTPRPAARAGAWEIPPIQCYEPEDGVFYAQMGPTGGRQGYPAITGHVGWGISWYINGLLIPEINVVRGRTYTFVVESGHDPEVPAKYHPFYITDDPVGGFEYKTDEEKQAVRIFAGVHRSRGGQVSPVGTGRLCNWTPDPDGPAADEYSSFGAYQRSLTLKCDEGEAGIIVWRPDEHTPDTVYYQCFTHRHLGWRINVLDHCDEGEASEVSPVYAAPPALTIDQQQLLDDSSDALLGLPSQRHETKVRPNEIFLLQHEKDLMKNHNMNEQPPKVKFDVNKNLEISKLISEGIRAAEELEESILRPNKTTVTTTTDGEHIEFKVVSKPNDASQHQHPTQPKPHQSADKEIPIFVSDTSILSEYLRPPGVRNGPLFRPVKVAGRPRPATSQVEMRRPTKPNGPYRQQSSALPQPSIIVNHYKKPVSPLLRPFIKPQKPIQSIASVLLLGQPTELNAPPARKHFDPKVYAEHGSSNHGPPNVAHLATTNGHKPPQKSPASYKPTGPFFKNQSPIYRDSYAPKFTHNAQGPPNSKPFTAELGGQIAQSASTQSHVVLRKKPIIREPLLPMKGAYKGTFKSPYEITGPKVLSSEESGPLNGFQPDTLIVEGGFKPIVRRRNGNSNTALDDEAADEIMLTSNRRSDDNMPAQSADRSVATAEFRIEASDDGTATETPNAGDALFVNQDIPTALFEPMFIPSPPDSINSSSKSAARPLSGQHRVNERLTGDLIDMDVEDGDDKVAEAGERVDAYYLPPDLPRTPPHSNFFPEGSVVTFDGKAVLDTSLVNSLPLPVSTYAHNSVGGPLSKTEQLVRSTPQFGPFRGEIPPIDFGPQALPARFQAPPGRLEEDVDHEVAATRGSNDGGVAASGRPVTEYTNPLTNSTNPISTRLVLLPQRNRRNDVNGDGVAEQADVDATVPERTMRVRGVVL